MLTRLVLAMCLLSSAIVNSALYSSNSAVVHLSAESLRKIVKSDGFWLVEFYADWCGHCQQFAPVYQKTAEALAGFMKVGAVDEQSIFNEFNVKGFPTIKLIVGDPNGKARIIDYEGARTATHLVDFVFKNIRNIVKTRLSGKEKKVSSESKVMVLTDSNFDSMVMEDPHNAWFVEFYAPWCGHCKALASEWESMASNLFNKIKVAKVDATTETALASRFSIKGYPTLLMFPAGKKHVASSVPYTGSRTAMEMTTFALGYSQSTVPKQLVNESIYRENCGNKHLCLIAVLPHILDGGAAERNRLLKELESVSRTISLPINFLWSQALDQDDLERKLNLAFGYPAVVIINIDKESFSVLRGAFSEDSIRNFLKISGNIIAPLPKGIVINTVKEWDGKDGHEPEEL